MNTEDCRERAERITARVDSEAWRSVAGGVRALQIRRSSELRGDYEQKCRKRHEREQNCGGRRRTRAIGRRCPSRSRSGNRRGHRLPTGVGGWMMRRAHLREVRSREVQRE